MRILGLTLMVSLLSACTEEEVEWNDVPLSENTFFEDVPEYRTDVIEIPVFALSDLEYKLEMEQGHAVAYSWEAVDLSDPELLLVEFHGHTVRESDEPGDVMFYKQGRMESSSGYMVAPFSGVHGWYLSNESSNDIKVILTLSGFYSIP